MLLAFVPEHRFASDDWHFDAVRSAHDSSAVEDSENLRIGRRMAKQAPACRNAKDRRLDDRPLENRWRERGDRHAVK